MKTKVVAHYSVKRGAPHEVVQVEEWELADLRPSQVRVRMICAPINPSDVNVLEGTYGISPALPNVSDNLIFVSMTSALGGAILGSWV